MVYFVHMLRDLRLSELSSVYSESLMLSASNGYPYLDSHEGYLNAQQDFYQYLREVFFCTDGAYYAIYEHDGAYVSALRVEPYRDGVLIAAVETAPEQRKRGFARKLIEEVLTYVRSRDISRIYAHVLKNNVPSLALHKTCGFSRIAENAAYIDGAVSDRACTFCYHLP